MQFFAATTLHTKVLKYWNEIPVDHYEWLKKRILEAIVSYAMGPKIVLNRLCITVRWLEFYSPTTKGTAATPIKILIKFQMELMEPPKLFQRVDL